MMHGMMKNKFSYKFEQTHKYSHVRENNEDIKQKIKTEGKINRRGVCLWCYKYGLVRKLRYEKKRIF
jgi:hypothetical protein